MVSKVSNTIQLPADAVARAKTEAQKEGVFAGLTSALASALIGAKAFGFKRYPTLVCGAITGVISGYLFTEAFHETHLARLQREAQKLAQENDTSSL
ncbi:hypothetical protein VKT23_008490 [Stygiomarasmius scandens]|uniref:Uncharacterized protein n=1 Tax=Marasmiellus scandens TaxID=2682957 RepID=A0ABR1JHG7_9AGAR